MDRDPTVLDDLVLDANVRQLFEFVPGLHFFIKDRTGKLIFCNETHRHSLYRFGSPDQIYGLENRDFFPETLAAAFADDDRHVIASGEPLIERVELNVTYSGVLSWFCTTKMPARNKRGEIVGLVGICRRLDAADARIDAFVLLMPAINYIHEHHTSDLKIATLARKCRMSCVVFHREFKKLFRITPARFIIRLRIHEACTLLAAHSKPIGEISAQCGFEDQNYFARQFKKIMGMTPSEFRRFDTKSRGDR